MQICPDCPRGQAGRLDNTRLRITRRKALRSAGIYFRAALSIARMVLRKLRAIGVVPAIQFALSHADHLRINSLKAAALLHLQRNHSWILMEPSHRSAERNFDVSLTVYLISYNYEHFLADALGSILRSSRDDFEVVVIDPASTDNTQQILTRYRGSERVRQVRRKEPHYLGCNRNYAARDAKTRYLAYLDADDMVYPEYYELVTFTAALYELDAVGAQVELFGNEFGTWDVPQFPDHISLSDQNGMPSQSVIAVTAVDAAGGYRDTGLGSEHIFEDWDFWYRLSLLGGRLANIGQKLIRYRIHTNNMSKQSGVPSAEVAASFIRKTNQDSKANALTRKSRLNAPTFELEPHTLVRPVQKVKTPNLVIMTPLLEVGGVMRMASHVAREAVKRGWTVFVCSTQDSAKDMSLIRDFFPSDRCYFFALERAMAPSEFPKWFSYLASMPATILWELGNPWLYGLQSPQWLSQFSAVFSTAVNESFLELQANLSQHFQAVILESDHLRGSLSRFPLKCPVSVIQNGVDLEVFAPTMEKTSRGALQVLWCGRFSEEKNPTLFLEIAHRAPANLYDFHIQGAGPLRRNLVTGPLSENLTWHSTTSRTATILGEMDILILTSLSEGSPNIILEAQAMGLCVVASAVGGVPGMISHNSDGILISGSSPEDYVEALATLSDAGTRMRMGTRARNRVVRDRDAQVMGRKYLDLFSAHLPVNLVADESPLR